MNGPVQGSTEWLQMRCGWLGASRMADVMAKGKSGAPSTTRANLMAEKITERLTGIPAVGFQSGDMTWGIEQEPHAISAYEFINDVDTEECSFIRHPSIEWAGASPDRLVGKDGLVEVKCMKSANHLETLLTETIDRRYVLQMAWQMAVTQRSWCDFVAYDPRMPPSMQLFQKRVHRDERLIAELTIEVRAFIDELNEKLNALHAKYSAQREAA